MSAKMTVLAKLTRGPVRVACHVMSIEQIQREVSRLPEAERRKLAAWMIAEFPPRSVSELVARAEAQARRGEWTPQPPTPDNIPTGAALEAAVRRAQASGIAR